MKLVAAMDLKKKLRDAGGFRLIGKQFVVGGLVLLAFGGGMVVYWAFGGPIHYGTSGRLATPSEVMLSGGAIGFGGGLLAAVGAAIVRWGPK
jgi:hypothetical protein